MTKEIAKQMREELKSATEAIFAKYGFKVNGSSISYNDYEVTFKVDSKAVEASGKAVVNPQEEARIELALGKVGKKIIGNEFNVKELGMCRIDGYNSRAKRYPIEVTTRSGEHYKVSCRMIQFD